MTPNMPWYELTDKYVVACGGYGNMTDEQLERLADFVDCNTMKFGKVINGIPHILQKGTKEYVPLHQIAEMVEM